MSENKPYILRQLKVAWEIIGPDKFQRQFFNKLNAMQYCEDLNDAFEQGKELGAQLEAGRRGAESPK